MRRLRRLLLTAVIAFVLPGPAPRAGAWTCSASLEAVPGCCGSHCACERGACLCRAVPPSPASPNERMLIRSQPLLLRHGSAVATSVVHPAILEAGARAEPRASAAYLDAAFFEPPGRTLELLGVFRV